MADLEFGELLGQGGFGTVFRGRWRSKGFDVALKKVIINPEESDAKVMKELGEHPNIISFLGFAYRRPETIVVTALAKKGSLFDYLHIRKEKPTEQQSLTWARQIAYGMAFMHRLDYVHRDLKSSNVLFSDDMVAQVSDFGTARFLKSSTVASKTAGTHRWMAPEVAQDDVINKKCDVFSYALVVWELMEHNIPYPEARTDIMASMAILSGERPPIGPNWPRYLSSLTQACWAPAPNDRPTFSDIVTSLENNTYFKR